PRSAPGRPQRRRGGHCRRNRPAHGSAGLVQSAEPEIKFKRRIGAVEAKTGLSENVVPSRGRRYVLKGFLRRFRIPLEGWCWLVALVVLWAVGLYKGFNVLTLLAAIMLVVWIVNAMSAWRSLRPLRMRRLVEGGVFAQTPVHWDVEIENSGPS